MFYSHEIGFPVSISPFVGGVKSAEAGFVFGSSQQQRISLLGKNIKEIIHKDLGVTGVNIVTSINAKFIIEPQKKPIFVITDLCAGVYGLQSV